MFDPAATPLSPLEARVLGVLVEKAATTPDSYPLSLNALVAGCNQKTSRDPVMNASDAQVQMAADALKRASLVIESSGSRVARYEHNVGRVLGVPQPAVALLAVLMLRGPQTPGELRINAERLHRFDDIAAVEALAEELMTRPGAALLVRLPRLPGAREARFAHLLCGAVAMSAAPGEPAAAMIVSDVSVAEIATLKATVAQLREEVETLRGQIARLYEDLGLRR
jgi:hypothetical protein